MMNMMRKIYWVVFVLLLGCGEGPKLTKFDQGIFPDSPRQLQVLVGDGKIVLTWTHNTPDSVDYYNVYRYEIRGASLDSSALPIDNTDSLTYVDTNVSNGVSYIYEVSAMRNTYESDRTRSTVASPTVFGVQINSGDEFTNSQTVTLTMISPVGTSFMRVSHDTLFATSVWEPYSSIKSWTLMDEDGEKWVYAHYRDAGGNETIKPSGDKIVLDTKANIISVTENTAGQTKSNGDIIHFTVNSAETDGVASVDLVGVGAGIRLFDDGSNGDTVADDGIYERDFQVPSNLEASVASVVGNFTDQLGNVAETLEAAGRITIQNPPQAVTLLTPEPVPGSFSSLNISWTQNGDADFGSYKLYRAQAQGVSLSSTFVTSITAQGSLSFTDTDLVSGTVYYYKVYVTDIQGLTSESNEVSGSPAQNQPPTAVTLLPPQAPAGSTQSLSISWTASSANDFASYKVYRSETAGVSTTSTLVSAILSPQTLAVDDNNLKENTTYFYKVFVFDTGGLFTGSNEDSGTTLANKPPDPVTLAQPVPNGGGGFVLSWSASADTDFDSYRIFRSETSPVDLSGAPIGIINSSNSTTFGDNNIQAAVTYYYTIVVFDSGGLSAASNEVSGTL